MGFFIDYPKLLLNWLTPTIKYKNIRSIISNNNNDNPQGDEEEEEELTLMKKTWKESKAMWVVAFPAIFTRFSTFGINIISQAFIGHVGSKELAAFALVFTIVVRFANGILVISLLFHFSVFRPHPIPILEPVTVEKVNVWERIIEGMHANLNYGTIYSLELWYNTILVLLTGSVENAEVEIDALSICLNINGWEMMISLGFMAAASVRVSNELGRGSSKGAKFSIVVTVLTSFTIGFLLFIFFLFFRERLAYIFTSNEDVAAAVGDLSPFLAISILLNSVQPVLSGVAVGAGWQSIVAYVNIGCYYIIGIPTGVLLARIIHLQVKGIWIGMLFGTFVQTIVLTIFTYKTDWDEQVIKARNRVNRWSTLDNDQETITYTFDK
ncbi:protein DETOXIFICATION 21 [Arachis hypogaea]|uniref:protein DETOXIFICATION 21 n=1 Tax=Arachis hypogaea TaxID=3818 RepID=UPI003B22162A